MSNIEILKRLYKDYTKKYLKSILISTFMFLLLSLLGKNNEINHWILLGITIPLGVLIYILLSFIGNYSTLIKVKQLFFSRT